MLSARLEIITLTLVQHCALHVYQGHTHQRLVPQSVVYVQLAGFQVLVQIPAPIARLVIARHLVSLAHLVHQIPSRPVEPRIAPRVWLARQVMQGLASASFVQLGFSRCRDKHACFAQLVDMLTKKVRHIVLSALMGVTVLMALPHVSHASLKDFPSKLYNIIGFEKVR